MRPTAVAVSWLEPVVMVVERGLGMVVILTVGCVVCILVVVSGLVIPSRASTAASAVLILIIMTTVGRLFKSLVLEESCIRNHSCYIKIWRIGGGATSPGGCSLE